MFVDAALTFGMAGIIGHYLGWSHPVSLALAVGLGLIGFIALLQSQQAASQVVLGQLVTRHAEVTVAIPQSGVGEVSLLASAEETAQLAESIDGAPIEAGREVVIRAVRGHQVVVEACSQKEVMR